MGYGYFDAVEDAGIAGVGMDGGVEIGLAMLEHVGGGAFDGSLDGGGDIVGGIAVAGGERDLDGVDGGAGRGP